MSGPTQEPPTARRRRRAVGPSASPGPAPGRDAHETGPLGVPAPDELGWGEVHDGPRSGSLSDDDDERLRREVPPHHGG